MSDLVAVFRLHRFERLLGEGGFGPFRILLVGQRVSRLAPAAPVGTRGKHVGSGDATVVLADNSGPLRLPDELIADLDEMQLPETGVAGRSAATRLRPERLHRAHYSYWAPLRSRIGDVDSNQHVNFIALATWYDEAYPGEYEIALTVRSVDTGSVHYELGVFRGSTCLGVADAIGPHGKLRPSHLPLPPA
ncbi:hypothetical protein ABT237_01745 [Streptomyces sp. NPDC001581]|uniref:hypothetical protein n=1 Tax=Streptomyces sp. NPDC001581 TaxID=3154386 RepID=UPI0033276C45